MKTKAAILLFLCLAITSWACDQRSLPPVEDDPRLSNRERATRAGTRYIRERKQKDLDSAYEFALAAYSEDPTSPIAASEAAMLGLALGEKDKARELLLKTAPYAEGFADYSNFAFLLLEVGEIELAKSFYELAMTAAVSKERRALADKVLLDLQKKFAAPNTNSSGRQP